MKCTVHKNLQNGKWVISVSGKVVGYCDACTITDVTYHLNANKQKWTRDRVRRSVHLWAKGVLTSCAGFVPKNGDVDVPAFNTTTEALQEVVYNPFKHDFFTYKTTGQKFSASELAAFADNGKMYVL